MRLVKTFGRSAKTADALIEALEHRGCRECSKGRTRGPANSCGCSQRWRCRADALCDEVRWPEGKASALQVPREDMKAAWEATTAQLQAAMMVARGNILAFAEAQLPTGVGRSLWQPGSKRVRLFVLWGSVGCYVPGGRYPLPSTLLMTVTPAQVAGWSELWSARRSPRRKRWQRPGWRV